MLGIVRADVNDHWLIACDQQRLVEEHHAKGTVTNVRGKTFDVV